MATPCRKCRATKTEPVRHGWRYNLARRFGYRLRTCSRCRRYRLVPLSQSADLPNDEQLEHLADDELESGPTGPVCPRCGKSDYRRSRRRWWERLLRRPPMVRCRTCRTRFPIREKTVHAAA